MNRRTIRLALLTSFVAIAMLLGGCGASSELTSVSEATGLFHVRVPEQWQSSSQPGLMVFYDAKELPASEDEAFDSLSIGIYTSDIAGTEPVGERLLKLLQARAVDRAWQNERLGKPAKTTVGKREGWATDVSGLDADGRAFAGRAALVRTNGREVLLFAVAPKEEWDDASVKIEDLVAEWYWHVPADRSADATGTTAVPQP